MSRQEFLNALQGSLTGRVNSSQIADNINYYEDYINTQVRMGKSEEEVIAGLGDPRLIAKSIIEASKHADARAESRESYGGEEENVYTSGYDGYHNSAYGRSQRRGMPVWLIVLLVILAVLLAVSMIFSVFIFLAPILIPIAFICLFLRLAGRQR
ncbi:MAG: DUF1700 domain-containing protein [Lachnospiraceae bacterium]|nr:DUF1700 domain-containing protein [Lachnospiraceae bacterium]